MRKEKIERIKKEAQLLVENEETLRSLSKKMDLSKSTIHQDLQVHLKTIDPILYEKVQLLFLKHKSLRHLIGGARTKEKYQKNRNRNVFMVE